MHLPQFTVLCLGNGVHLWDGRAVGGAVDTVEGGAGELRGGGG